MQYAHSRTARFGVLLLAALLTTSCGSAPESTTTDGTTVDETAWTTSTDPVTAGGLLWATDNVIHLTDDTTLDAGQPMETWVVAGDGVYFTSPDEGPQDDVAGARRLHYTDRDGTTIDTGLNIYPDSLAASSDGRYLGLIDATSGERDHFSNYPVATLVIIDTTTGKRVVDTTEGMGDPDEQDLDHDYQEIYLKVHFPTDTTAHVEGWVDHTYTLPDGTGTPTDIGPRSPEDRTSPDGKWAIQDDGFNDRVIDAANGKDIPIETKTPRRNLMWWLDDGTIVGVAIPGPGSGQELSTANVSTLITCTVTSGSCTPVEGTTGAVLSFPNDSGGIGLNLSATTEGES